MASDTHLHEALTRAGYSSVPLAMQGGPDRRLTPERDAALRALGFVCLGWVRLGIVADESPRPAAPLGSDRID